MNERNSFDSRRFPCGRVAPCTLRRDFLSAAAGGLGLSALAGMRQADGRLAAEEGAAAAGANKPLAPKAGHFPAKAKNVIWLFMEGGPSGFDLFDPKPQLQAGHGKRIPIETFFGDPGPLMRSPFEFKQHGETGAWVCDKLPRLAEQVDRIAWLKGCWSESNNHAPAMFQMNSGLTRSGFPAAGSWITYGLGSENQDLPGFVVLGNNRGSKGGPENWAAGFLPSTYQGTLFRASGSPILNLDRPAGVRADDQRAQLELLRAANAEHQALHPGEPDLAARIESFELAYRMQSAAKEAVDLAGETKETHKRYGIDKKPSENFGRKCLLARRLVERGVRFVQVYCDGEWDAHGDLRDNHTKLCEQTDAGVAGLLADLHARGLLESTLVIWGGEFGRMPVSEKGLGRDHNPHGFLTWMAGAGVRPGASFGATDEFGHKAVEGRTSVHDIHATLLHLLGLDHKRLTYLHNGRRYRLTDVAGRVVNEILV